MNSMRAKSNNWINKKIKLSVGILTGLVLVLTLISSLVLAGDPTEKDNDFLMGDPDGDMIKNWEEFLIGTDPFNADSDNDGLPDWWELEYSQWVNPRINAQMDPTDASDSHKDFDYDPVYDASGYNVGERDAKFDAVRTLRGGKNVTWPANSQITFVQPVFDEEGPHYDNYEEYYRPYTDPVDKKTIKYMHTSPIYSDTDGDHILDPDDYIPLGINDSVDPGAVDGSDSKKTEQNNEDNDLYKNKVISDLENTPPLSIINDLNNIDLDTEITIQNNKNKIKDTSLNFLPDSENDGI